MSETSPLIPLKTTLADLLSWLQSEQVEGVIIGGVAASLLGRPRATRDVDAVVWIEEDDWQSLLDAGGRHGFVPRISDVLSFAQRSRVLLMTHPASGIDVDLSFGSLPFERAAITGRVEHDLAGLKIPLPRPEDLVIMKAIAHRPRDQADIEGLLQAHPHLDRQYVTSTVREFSTVLDAPELIDDLERIFARILD